MTAAEIIDEIKQLPADEKTQVLRFVRALDGGRQWTGAELTQAARKFAEEPDPAKAQALWEQIAAGFYGEENAESPPPQCAARGARSFA